MVCAPVRRDYRPYRRKARGLSLRTGAQTMLYLTCTTITSVDLAHYGVSRAKDWVYVDCGTSRDYFSMNFLDMFTAYINLTWNTSL